MVHMVWVSKNKMCSRMCRRPVAVGVSAELPIIRECGVHEQCVIYVCSLSDVSVIACADMENVYKHASRRLKHPTVHLTNACENHSRPFTDAETRHPSERDRMLGAHHPCRRRYNTW